MANNGVARAGRVHALNCRGQLQVPVQWQGPVSDTNIVVGTGRATRADQIAGTLVAVEAWLSANSPMIAQSSHHHVSRYRVVKAGDRHQVRSMQEKHGRSQAQTHTHCVCLRVVQPEWHKLMSCTHAAVERPGLAATTVHGLCQTGEGRQYRGTQMSSQRFLQ